jgi:hypothetical protein
MAARTDDETVSGRETLSQSRPPSLSLKLLPERR